MICKKLRDRDMLFHDVVFAAVFFAFYPSGKARMQNWVKQWPGEVYRTPGENITMHCHTHGDIQEAICLVHWYNNRDGRYDRIDKLPQFSGRHSEHKKANHSRSSFTLTSLELNDTGLFYCNYICRINGTPEQYYGTGTRLFVHFSSENVTHGSPLCTSNITDGVEDEYRVYLLFPFLVLIVLLSKLVVFMFMSSIALFSSH
ncbi:uncharacterized protein [Chanodichthys erythropterus]|uniref:uncharacterized protein n=1 Tax=Chanodichthys erythropterus TaxID=933992 RepID=UPI00351F46E2